MSYGKLRHGNQSSHAINQLRRSPSPPLDSDSDSDDHVGIGLRGGEISDEDEDESEDKEKGPDFEKRCREESDSTVHSFMLYTPDEEKAVIRKFDRRLLLFVALLYMLSFLDWSSMSLSFRMRNSIILLLSIQILEMHGLLVWREIRI